MSTIHTHEEPPEHDTPEGTQDISPAAAGPEEGRPSEAMENPDQPEGAGEVVIDSDADPRDDDGPTLLEVVRGEVAEEDITPEMRQQLDKLAKSVPDSLATHVDISATMRRTIENLRQSLALSAAEPVRKMLAQNDAVVRNAMNVVAKQVPPQSLLITDRIAAQLAASMPDLTPWTSKQFQPLLNNLAKSISSNVELTRVVKLSPDLLKNLHGPGLDRIAGQLFNFQELFKNVDWALLKDGWYPRNWDPDRGPEQFEGFIKLAREEGLPLAWVPNTELTYLLLEAADADARAALLIEHESTILADCRAVLGELENREYLTGQMGRAFDACEAGFHEPAQSYAASIIDTVLREVFISKSGNWGYKHTVRGRLQDGTDWLKLPLRLVRLIPTSVALLNVLQEFWLSKGDPVPTTPNRHAAAHAVAPDQYNQVNAIKFMMLATAILAEAEYGTWTRLIAHADAANAAA